MSLTRSIARNTISQTAGKLISTVLGLLSISIITRYLGQEGFGEYTTVVTFLQFFGIMADFGLTLITVRMISQVGADQDKTLANLFTLRLLSGVIFFGLAPLVVLAMPYSLAIKKGVAIAAASFLFIAVNQVLTGIFQKNLDMNKVALAEIVNRLLLLALTWLVWVKDYGLSGVLLAIVISNLLQFAILYFSSRKYTRLHLAFDMAVWRKIIELSWPIAVSIGLNLIYLKSDTLILSLVDTQSAVGIYGAAYKVIDVLITVPIMFAGLILPLMTHAWSSNDREKFKLMFQKGFDVLSLLAVPMVVGTWLVSQPMMVLIAGQDFAISGDVLNVLIIAAGVIFLGSFFGHAIVALNVQKKTIWAYGATAVLSLAGYLVFIPIYSYFGAAWMTVFSESFVTLSIIYVFYKTTRFLPSLRTPAKAALASLIMALCLLGIQKIINTDHITLNLVVYILSSCVIYLAGLLILRAIDKESIKLIFSKAPAAIAAQTAPAQML